MKVLEQFFCSQRNIFCSKSAQFQAIGNITIDVHIFSIISLHNTDITILKMSDNTIALYTWSSLIFENHVNLDSIDQEK